MGGRKRNLTLKFLKKLYLLQKSKQGTAAEDKIGIINGYENGVKEKRGNGEKGLRMLK